MWIDVHAHLYEYGDDELGSIINQAHGASVSRVVSTAVSIETARIVKHQCAIFTEILGAVGISPFDINNLGDTWISDLSSLLNDKRIIAIGEIGIDNSNPLYPPLEKQIPVFERQLQLAKTLDLPVILHSRGAEQQALTLCKDHQIEKAVFHCFTGDRNVLRNIINHHYFVSLSGIVTFKNAAIRELVSMIPLEQLLIETDSPYLTPVPYRGQKNTPAMVRLVGETIAALYKKEPEYIAHQVATNFDTLTRSGPDSPGAQKTICKSRL